MSVVAYLDSKSRHEARMPECPGGVDSLGIRWSGEVLTGRLGVREAVSLAGKIPRGGQGEQRKETRGTVGWK